MFAAQSPPNVANVVGNAANTNIDANLRLCRKKPKSARREGLVLCEGANGRDIPHMAPRILCAEVASYTVQHGAKRAMRCVNCNRGYGIEMVTSDDLSTKIITRALWAVEEGHDPAMVAFCARLPVDWFLEFVSSWTTFDQTAHYAPSEGSTRFKLEILREPPASMRPYLKPELLQTPEDQARHERKERPNRQDAPNAISLEMAIPLEPAKPSLIPILTAKSVQQALGGRKTSAWAQGLTRTEVQSRAKAYLEQGLRYCSSAQAHRGHEHPGHWVPHQLGFNLKLKTHFERVGCPSCRGRLQPALIGRVRYLVRGGQMIADRALQALHAGVEPVFVAAALNVPTTDPVMEALQQTVVKEGGVVSTFREHF